MKTTMHFLVLSGRMMLFVLLFQLPVFGQKSTGVNCNTSSVTTVTACNSYTWNGKTFTASTVNACIGGIKALDGSNKYYKYATVYDWDCCLFGGSPVNEGGFGYMVDGHYKIQYDCNGNGIVVEATGNYAGYLGTTRNDNFGFSSNPTWKSLITNGGCCNADGSKIFVQLTGLVKDGYTIKLTNAAGCDSIATLMLTINKKVVIGSVSADQNPACSTATLTANGVSGTNAVVNWFSGSNGTGTLFGTGPTLINATPGTYYARVTGTCGPPVQRLFKLYGDTVAPTIACPSNIVVSSANCSKVVTTPVPVYSDNCGIKKLIWNASGATVLNSPLNGIRLVGKKTFNAGNTLVTYKLTDASGNTSSCSFNVEVNTTAVCLNKMDEKIPDNELGQSVLSAKLTPNPTRSAFGLMIQSSNEQLALVNVYNSNGRKIELIRTIPNKLLFIGNGFKQGCYLFEIIQGEKRTVVKGVKQ